MKTTAIIVAIVMTASLAWGHATYIGYSGAPGSRGACSISCHHRHSFTPTITVTGFPTEYQPEQQYTVSVAHQGGSSIRQFNSSVRIGTGSSNGGTLDAGTNTITYTHSQETNGIHFSAISQDAGTFLWTAPTSGTGTVRLYWAGLQGSYTTGADTQVVLVSNEIATGIEHEGNNPQMFSLSQNYPNPFNAETIINFNIAQSGHVDLAISNIIGQQVYGWSDEIDRSGPVSIRWNGKGSAGTDLPSGVYFYQLRTSAGTLTRQMLLLR